MSIMTMSLPANQLSKMGQGILTETPVQVFWCIYCACRQIHKCTHARLDAEMEEQFSSNKVAVCY